MCCSSRTATVVLCLLEIIGGLYFLVSPIDYSWPFRISSICSIVLGYFGCSAVVNDKHEWVTTYACLKTVILVVDMLRSIVYGCSHESIKNDIIKLCENRKDNHTVCPGLASFEFGYTISFLVIHCAFNLWMILAAFYAARSIKNLQTPQNTGSNS